MKLRAFPEGGEVRDGVRGDLGARKSCVERAAAHRVNPTGEGKKVAKAAKGDEKAPGGGDF